MQSIHRAASLTQSYVCKLIGLTSVIGIVASTLFISGCVNVKPERDIAIRGLLSNSYWHSTTNNCRVVDEHMLDNATYEWSGSCQNGLVTGCGQLVKRDSGNNIERMNGCFSGGKKNGRFTVTNSLLPGKTTSVDYSMGQVTDYDVEPPNQPSVVRQMPDAPKTVGRGARGV